MILFTIVFFFILCVIYYILYSVCHMEALLYHVMACSVVDFLCQLHSEKK